MQKNQLLKSNDNEIVRILAVNGDEVLYISCNKEKKGMPQWASVSMFSGYLTCPEEELQQLWGIGLAEEGELEVKERKTAIWRYAVIAPVLSFLEDDRLRTEAIRRAAEQNHITKQTVRNYLQRYLIFNNVSALVPKKRTIKEKPLSGDEKNIRLAVNKYYYSRKKNSLNTAYKLMLKEKYTNAEGVLEEEYPSFNQFRYWYAKNKKYMSYYISREGKTGFMRNHRVLVGGTMYKHLQLYLELAWQTVQLWIYTLFPMTGAKLWEDQYWLHYLMDIHICVWATALDGKVVNTVYSH